MKPDAGLSIGAARRPSFGRFAACATFAFLPVMPGICAEEILPGPLAAQFRSCDTAGWCRFSIDSPGVVAEPLPRVRPNGVPCVSDGDELSVALRDRLNALLADMIHQHKRIALHDFLALQDGTYAATVTVNGVTLASDPILAELRKSHTGATR
jgi:hypothetical protein